MTGSITSLSQTVIATSEHVAKQTDNLTRMAIEITTLRVLLQSTREELRAARGSNTDETGRQHRQQHQQQPSKGSGTAAIDKTSDSAVQLRNTSRFLSQQLTDSALAATVHIDTAMTIGAVVAFLANDSLLAITVNDGRTDLTPNNFSIMLRSKKTMTAVANPEEMSIWNDALRMNNSSLSTSSSAGGGSFRILALTLEARVKKRLEIEEAGVGSVSNARQLTLNSFAARMTTLRKISKLITSRMESKPDDQLMALLMSAVGNPTPPAVGNPAEGRGGSGRKGKKRTPAHEQAQRDQHGKSAAKRAKKAAFQTKPAPSQSEEQEPEMRYAVIAAGAAPHQAGGAAGLSAAQQSSPEQLPLQAGGAVGLSAAQQTEQPWGVSD